MQWMESGRGERRQISSTIASPDPADVPHRGIATLSWPLSNAKAEAGKKYAVGSGNDQGWCGGADKEDRAAGARYSSPHQADHGAVEPECHGHQGQVDQDPYQVDGLSGATITSRGVTGTLAFWMGDEGFGPYMARLRTSGGSN